jgi:hypothetical protein
MKTKAELEQDIVKITLKIHKEFPELIKYINEIPENFSGKDTSRIDTENLKEYYNSLEEVLFEYTKTHQAKNEKSGSKTIKLDGYPHYPSSEDIYNHDQEEKDLNPEDISKKKTPNEKEGTPNEKDFRHAMSGSDLDVPGSELDDQQERVGSEDEENNYYSLGGDAHNDLDEDNG